MKIKAGRAKIQLFDAKTGALVKEHQSKNLVTNAARNILNGYLAQAGYMNFNDLVNQIGTSLGAEAIWKNLFGGLLIFGSEITEDADHIIPTGAERDSYVGGGFQGATQSGSSFLGTINSELSGVDDTSVTMVWDFTTGQGNGDIAAICLTSNCGGACGFKDNRTDLTTVKPSMVRTAYNTNMFNPAVFNNNYVLNTKYIHEADANSNGNFLIPDSVRRKFYFAKYADANVYELDMTRRCNRKVGVLESGKAAAPSVAHGTISDWNAARRKGQIPTFDADGTFYSFNANNVTDCWIGDDGHIYINKVDMINGSYTEVTTDFRTVNNDIVTEFNLSDTYYVRKAFSGHILFIYNGYIYEIHANGFSSSDVGGAGKLVLYKVSLADGTYIKKVINNNAELHRFLFNNGNYSWYYQQQGTWNVCRICGEFYVATDTNPGSSYSNIHPFYHLNIDTLELSEHPSFIGVAPVIKPDGNGCLAEIKSDAMYKEPFVVSTQQPYLTTNKVEMLGVWMFMPYLATINNLEEVLTKDTTKTMRITYVLELVDE